MTTTLKMIATEVRYAIADALSFPNERIEVVDTADDIVWFRIGDAAFTCRTVRNGSRLKANSIRKD